MHFQAPLEALPPFLPAPRFVTGERKCRTGSAFVSSTLLRRVLEYAACYLSPRFAFVKTRIVSGLFILIAAASANAETSITFTRDEVAAMGQLWETDTLAISPLANAQYPPFSGAWQFIFPRANISDDRDVHVDMALDAAGTGRTGNNTGSSPIVCELTNATSSQLGFLSSLSGQRATFRGIFRFYTEHTAERHFELHPVTELDRWNGSTFARAADYHANVAAVADGFTHQQTTLTRLLDRSQTITARVQSDNARVDFTFPSPSVNYVQYDGTAVSSVTSDVTSSYFLFRPDLVPSALVKCRLVANTGGASAATDLRSNQPVSVNALTRTDMARVAEEVAPVSAGQAKIFPRPIEFITLALPAIGPAPATAQLLNVSTRVNVGTDDNNAIGGFIITGNAEKRLLIRILGPSLGDAGVSGALADPTVELRDSSGQLLAANDNWKESQQAEIEATGIPPRDDRESAVVQTLAPGAYTAVVRGQNRTAGVGLIEVYDLAKTADAQLGNISTRGVVGSADNVMIGGFIVGGGTGGSARVIVRAIGPSLAASGVRNALQDPAVELRDANGATLATNDNWRDSQQPEIEATGIPPTSNLESAIVRTLAPGAYTAIVRSVDGTGSVALVEVYNLR